MLVSGYQWYREGRQGPYSPSKKFVYFNEIFDMHASNKCYEWKFIFNFQLKEDKSALNNCTF